MKKTAQLPPNQRVCSLSHRVRSHHPKGSFLIEASVSLFLLVAISIVLVNASMNILQPRTWTMQQNLVDAYLSQEVAAANSADFSNIADGTSDWGDGRAEVVGNITLGFLPGFTEGGAGRGFTGSIIRRRVKVQSPSWGRPDGIANLGGTPAAESADPDEVEDATFAPGGGRTALTLADLGIQAYQLQSHLLYTVGDDVYVKSRTVIRSQ